MSQPDQAPERIHGWLNTQLSIARFYGGISFNGQRYVIAFNEPGQPLVRQDVLAREAKEKKKQTRQAAKANKIKQQEIGL